MTIVTQDKALSYIQQVLGNHFIPYAIETYSCFHLHFDSFLTSYVHASITHHQQTSLIPIMLICHKQQSLIALQHVQPIAILQWATTYNHNFSSLPHVLINALFSLADL
jgi:hypothetical protein